MVTLKKNQTNKYTCVPDLNAIQESILVLSFMQVKIMYGSGMTGVRSVEYISIFIYFFINEFSRRFQQCMFHVIMGSFMGRRNQYIQLVKVLDC